MSQTSIKLGLGLSPLLEMFGFGCDFLCGLRRFVPWLLKIMERAERSHVLMSCEFRMLQACDRFSVSRSRVGVCWPSNEKDSSMREVEQRKQKLTTTRVIKKHLEFDWEGSKSLIITRPWISVIFCIIAFHWITRAIIFIVLLSRFCLLTMTCKICGSHSGVFKTQVSRDRTAFSSGSNI